MNFYNLSEKQKRDSFINYVKPEGNNYKKSLGDGIHKSLNVNIAFIEYLKKYISIIFVLQFSCYY